MSERIIILLTEADGKEPCVHIYRGDLESVRSSFTNCSATTTGDKARMTLLDIAYGEKPSVEMWVKDLPHPVMRIRKEGYKLSQEVDKPQEVRKNFLEKVKKWLLKLIK